jgi:mRNA-degrading endonuclease RelE of RelBE toxin-antitoxin system
MKLFIHDKCLEKLFELPKATSKKVLEFQKKFRENSRSEAIHLESIKTFKDQSLRTARIDQKYRAIIRVPDTGDSYYMLWVDNHDEAMDWAKNKIFEWNEITQTVQIFESPDTIEISPSEQSIGILGVFSHYTDEELKQIGVPVSLLSLVKSIQDLHDLELAEKYLPTETFENLFYLSEGISLQLLITEINEGKSKSENPEEHLTSINNKRCFVEVDDKLMDEIINGDLSKWQIFLHPSQRRLVESNFKGSVKVTGGAGTGKTVVALHRLKFLSNLLNTSDQRKVVFTTFTNALTTNLHVLASKLQIDNSKIHITNIDTLLKELAIESLQISKTTRILDMFNSKSSIEVWDEILEKNLTSFDTNFLSSEFQNVILYNDIKDLETYLNTSRIGRGKPITRKQKMDIWSLVEKYSQYKKDNNLIDRSELFNKVSNHFNNIKVRPFKNVIADEVQDLSNVELRFLRSLVEEKENDLFLVGDPYQKIYARRINFSAAGISVRGHRSKQLRINYRTSEEIKKLAITTIKGLNYDDFDGELETLSGYLSLFHGEAPTYEVFKTKNEEINSVISQINELRENGLRYNEIAVGFRTKDALRELKTTLHQRKIPYNDNTTSVTNDSGGVVLSTLHGLKGLEFKAVFLADINNRTCPLYFNGYNDMEEQEKTDYINSEKSLIYVAITRAINILKITGTGIKSVMIGI